MKKTISPEVLARLAQIAGVKECPLGCPLIEKRSDGVPFSRTNRQRFDDRITATIETTQFGAALNAWGNHVAKIATLP